MDGFDLRRSRESPEVDSVGTHGPRPSWSGARIAILIPCFNEAITVARVVREMAEVLPDATVYVYDNNSTDDTAIQAQEAGAVLGRERLRGKGNVVRRMFADIEADVYLLTDGDATYDPTVMPDMIRRLIDGNLDMVVGRRIHEDRAAYRPGHVLGNRLLTAFLARLFGNGFRDIFSGCRVFSRRFVKSFPSLSHGFEIETELSIHALNLNLPVDEVDIRYGARPSGSTSKLNTYRDGVRIARVMISMFKTDRPLAFFGGCGVVLALLAVGLSLPIFRTYLNTGLVPRYPTTVLSAAMMILAFLSITCGLVLDTVTHGRREMKRLAYLSVPPLPTDLRMRVLAAARRHEEAAPLSASVQVQAVQAHPRPTRPTVG